MRIKVLIISVWVASCPFSLSPSNTCRYCEEKEEKKEKKRACLSCLLVTLWFVTCWNHLPRSPSEPERAAAATHRLVSGARRCQPAVSLGFVGGLLFNSWHGVARFVRFSLLLLMQRLETEIEIFFFKHQSKVWHGGLIVTWIARMSVKFALNRSRILISSWPINNCILSLNIKANEANFTSGSSHLRSHSTLARFHMMNCHTKSGGENDFYSSIWRKLVFFNLFNKPNI